MMFSSQLDGGLFSSSQSTQSPDSTASKSRGSSSTTLPLTVKQISEAYDSRDEKSPFVVDGVEVGNIVLVGLISNKVARATDVTFTLDDGTGRMDFIRWVNETSDASETAVVQNGMYVTLIGSLKGFQDRKRATAFAVRPIEDHNQIVLHFIQCVRIHLENTKSKIGSPAQTHTNSVSRSSLSNGFKDSQTPVSNKAAVNNNGTNGSETDIYKLVLDFFQEPESLSSDHGVHVDEVVRRLGLPANKIKEAIEYHVDVGHIYSTIDDYHFKSACVD